MFTNYLITGLRAQLKEKGYAMIKIAGLAFGLATTIIICLFVIEDLSYDKFHSNYARIVRLLTIDNAEGVSSKLVGVTQPRLGPAAHEELPEVLQSVRFIGGGRYDLSYGEKSLFCEAAFRVDQAVFEVFDFPAIEGTTDGALDQPGSIVITRSLARKLFGEEPAVGKTLKLNLNTDLHITAVIEDPPATSHLRFDLLQTLVPGPDEQGLRQALETWQGIFCFTYLLLDSAPDESDLNEKLQAISRKNNAFAAFTPVVQQLKDVHLRSREILFETNANKSDVQNVYVLSVVAGLIVLLAIVNFINLVTARSMARAKEVGLRRIIGAAKRQLITQHLTESAVIACIAGLLAVGLVFLLMPSLNSVYQRHANPMLLFSGPGLVVLVLLVGCVGFLAGIYPAFVLSSFRPVDVMKGTFRSSPAGIRLRKSLVVVQFTISIALTVGTVIVYEQMKYIFTADLGYSRDQVITIQQNGPAIDRTQALREELLRDASIAGVGTSSTRLGQQLGRTGIFPEGATSETNIITSIMSVDEHFIPTMNMKVVAGRNFSPDFHDSLSMIVNEEMLRLLEWQDGVGRKISLQSGPDPDDRTAYTVVGVVRDFHFATIRHKLEPLFMLYDATNPSMAIRVKTSDMQRTINHIGEAWNKVNPGTTFEYAFLDEQFATLYINDQAFARMFSHFTGLAIFIACLGLFALAAFTAGQRKKEISIRKVLGATSWSILYRLTGEFIVLTLLAFVVASVIAWFVMNRWLDDFQYSIRPGAGVFLASGAISMVIAVMTVSFQALRAAWSNPAEALRVE